MDFTVIKCAGTAAAISLLLLAGGAAHAKARQCANARADAAAVDRTIRSFFDALSRDDAAAVARVTTPGFYAYDAGKRFTAGELVAVVRGAHAQGVKLEWHLGAIDAHVGCDMAWAAWENRGSAGVPPQITPLSWLESATLRRTGPRWRIDFFHSTRVTARATGR